MPYTKTNWTDRVVARPLTYTFQNNGDGSTTLVPSEGTITSTGTPLNALALNNLEKQYDQAMADANLTFLKLTGGTITGNIIMVGDITSNGYTVDASSLRQGGVRITDMFLPFGGGTLTGTLTGTVINATTNLQEGGANISTKYAQLIQNNTLTAINTFTNNLFVDRTTSQASLLNVKNSTDDGNMRFTTTATTNFIQSGTYSGASAKNLTIGGYNGTTIGTLTLTATTVTASATLNAVTLQEGGTNLTAKYGQLGANNTFTGTNNFNAQVTVDRATTGVNLFIARNSVDDGGMRLITTASNNFLQSGNYAANAPKNFTINGWSSTTIPVFTVTATTTNFSGTISGTTINATTELQENGIPIGSKYYAIGGGLINGTVTIANTLTANGTSILNGLVNINNALTLGGGNFFKVADSSGNTVNFLSTQVGDGTGIGIALSSGGKMVIGGGESATTVMNDASTGTGNQEMLYLTADNDIMIWSNVQSGVASKHELKFARTGIATLDGDVIARPEKGNNLWTGNSIFVGSTVISLGVNILDCPNGIMLEWRQASGTAFLHHEPIWKNNAQDSVSHMNAGYNNPATYCGKNYTVTGGGTTITGSDTNNTGVMANRVLTRIYMF